jgi:hypothetical protein
MKYFIIIILNFIFSYVVAQSIDTININHIEYKVYIDTFSHKVKAVQIIEEEKFFEKIYIGTEFGINKGNINQKLIYDITKYSKISVGYDLGTNIIGIGAYVNLGRLYKRKYDLNAIYF